MVPLPCCCAILIGNTLHADAKALPKRLFLADSLFAGSFL
jgi:hypothetical protein